VRGAAYLLRFDDLCPTMNWGRWDRIEGALIDAEIRPILAVIPDNREEKLLIDPPNDRFWDRVRAWQARGWSIGLHGYQMQYLTAERGLFGWNDRSEFAGLSFEQQDDRVERAMAIFRGQGVVPDVWVAPNHSFDLTTVAVLRRRGIRVISDGLALLPYRHAGMLWVPVQLWRFLSRPAGVWTICNHPNKWGAAEEEGFYRDLQRFRPRVTDMDSVLARYGGRDRSWADSLFAFQRRAKKRVHTLHAPARALLAAGSRP
jgi:predicted deacetylase